MEATLGLGPRSLWHRRPVFPSTTSVRGGQKRSGKESTVKGSVGEVTPENNTEAESFKSRRRPRDFQLSEVRVIGTIDVTSLAVSPRC